MFSSLCYRFSLFVKGLTKTDHDNTKIYIHKKYFFEKSCTNGWRNSGETISRNTTNSEKTISRRFCKKLIWTYLWINSIKCYFFPNNYNFDLLFPNWQTVTYLNHFISKLYTSSLAINSLCSMQPKAIEGSVIKAKKYHHYLHFLSISFFWNNAVCWNQYWYFAVIY